MVPVAPGAVFRASGDRSSPCASVVHGPGVTRTPWQAQRTTCPRELCQEPVAFLYSSVGFFLASASSFANTDWKSSGDVR